MFKFITNENEKAKVTEEYVDSIEKKLNIKFPEILREYYLKHNGANIKECSFKIAGIDKFSLDIIIPLKYGTTPLEKEYKWVLGNEYISNEHIPLACDILGENFYWNSKSGKVYYISQGNVENPILVCNSVEEFFEILNKSFDKMVTIPNLNKIPKKVSNSKESIKKKKEKQNNIIFYVTIILVIAMIIYGVFNKDDGEKESNVEKANAISTETMKQQSQELDDRFNKIFNEN